MSSVQPSLYPIPPAPRKPRSTQERAHDKAKLTKRDFHLLLLKSYYEGSHSADQWATERGFSILRIRPRVSEMNKKAMLHRVGYGLTIDGNDQDKFTLYPYIRSRMQLLVCKFGLDRAAEEILAVYNL